MATSAPNPLDKPPRLPTEGIPSAEDADALWHLHKALRLIMQHTSDFAQAIVLFDFCTDGLDAEKSGGSASKFPLRGWRLMAGRDAGMSMYHFGMTIKTVGKFAGRYPWIKTNVVDLGVVKDAKNLMAQTFPGWQRTRHAIAHRADFFLDPAESRQHAIKVDRAGRTETYWNRLRGREFSHSLNGKHCVCEVSEQTLDKLIEIRRKFFSAFKTTAPN